jgi:hypothetical protein
VSRGLQVEKEWVNTGLGNLQLRRPQGVPTGAPGARLVMYNQTGKLVLNAKLYANMKAKHVDKGVVVLLVNGAAQAASGDDQAAASKPTQFMLRVKDKATAQDLARLIGEHAPNV